MSEDQRRYDTGQGQYATGRAPNQQRGTTVSQRGRPRGSAGGRSAPSGVMRFVDSMMSPFVQCWQPPLDTCTTINLSNYGPGCGDASGGGSGASKHPSINQSAQPSNRATMDSPAATRHSSPPPPQPSPMAYDYTHAAQPHPSIITDVTSPSEADVLCGRGGSSNRHNVHFRELVAANKATYTTLTKKQKMLFSRKVVDQVHKAGGRFLAKDQSTGRWCDIGLQRSLEKASQALREKTTNFSPNTSVIISHEGGGIEATAEMEPSSKLNPRTTSTPSLVIPHHLEHIYVRKPVVVTPTNDQGKKWVAKFPSLSDSSSSYHPSDRMQSMPAPHMGTLPFTTRQMSRLNRQPNRVRSIPAHATPPMVSPIVHQTMSWQQPSPQHDPLYSTPKASFERQPSPDYPSSTASCNSLSSAATQSAPESHQYCADFEPPRSISQAQHPHPRQEHLPEVKRQRTREEEKREQHDEEEVILVDNGHQNTLNTSLQEGSEQLPEEVESKLCLHDKAICSPSEILQSRSSRRRGESYYHHDTSMTSTNTNSKEWLNTSAEAADLAGLTALSAAAHLRLDEGE